MTPIAWRKSSRSQNNGNCVEVGCVHDVRNWRKSTRTGNNGNCVEAATANTIVAVRDSKLPTTRDFPVLTMNRSDWVGLLAKLRSGDLDG